MTSDVVLDASAVIDAILGRSRWQHYEHLHSHAGLDIEVLAVLRRCVLHETLSPSRARDALDDFRALDISRHPLARFIPRIWSLRNSISAYDAGYVALAEGLGAPLVTLDRRLATAAQRHCDVIVP